MDIDAAINRLSEILAALENKSTNLSEIPILIKEAGDIKKMCETYIKEVENAIDKLETPEIEVLQDVS